MIGVKTYESKNKDKVEELVLRVCLCLGMFLLWISIPVSVFLKNTKDTVVIHKHLISFLG